MYDHGGIGERGKKISLKVISWPISSGHLTHLRLFVAAKVDLEIKKKKRKHNIVWERMCRWVSEEC